MIVQHQTDLKLNPGAPAKHCSSVTTQVESEFKNNLFSITNVGFKYFFFPSDSIGSLISSYQDISGSWKFEIENRSVCVYIHTYINRGCVCDGFIFGSVSK